MFFITWLRKLVPADIEGYHQLKLEESLRKWLVKQRRAAVMFFSRANSLVEVGISP
jgi:hypothetical protein